MVWTNNTNSGRAIFSLGPALCKQSLLLRGGLMSVPIVSAWWYLSRGKRKSFWIVTDVWRYDLHHYENSRVVLWSPLTKKLLLWDGQFGLPVRTEGAAQSTTRNFVKPLKRLYERGILWKLWGGWFLPAQQPSSHSAEISVVLLALWIPRDIPPVVLLETHPATLLSCSASS